MSKHHRKTSSQDSFLLKGLQLLSIVPEDCDVNSLSDENNNCVKAPASIESFDLSSKEDNYVYSEDEMSLLSLHDLDNLTFTNENIIEGGFMEGDDARLPTGKESCTNKSIKLTEKQRATSSKSEKELQEYMDFLLSDRFRFNLQNEQRHCLDNDTMVKVDGVDKKKQPTVEA